MKTSLNKFYFLLLLVASLFTACTITTEDDTVDPNNPLSLSEMETFGWVYSEITFNGSGMGTDCNNISVTLSNATTNQDLTIQNCAENSITAWIPEDMATGTYDVTLNVDGTSFSSINGEDLQVEVRIRPVILTMSTTEIAPEGTLEITGLYIVNESTNAVYDPKVWLTRSNYTNTVSEITVNADGTAATIIIDDNLEPGVYDFKITCVEWSNEIEITIL